MPDLEKTKELLEVAFINGWGSTTPIKFDNLNFDQTGIKEYVEVRFINYSSKNPNIGSGLYKRKRHTGVLSIRVFVEKTKGTKKAYAYADQIASIMDNLMQSNLFTDASETRRVGETDGGWFVLIVDVPYISDEV